MADLATQRFEPNTHAVRKEQLWIGAVAAVLGPGILYLEGERNVLLLLLLGTIGAILGYGIYAVRNRMRAVRRIDITPTALLVALPRKELCLPWHIVNDVKHLTHHGDFLAVYTRENKRPHTLLIEGFTPEQIAVIIARIHEKRQPKEQHCA